MDVLNLQYTIYTQVVKRKNLIIRALRKQEFSKAPIFGHFPVLFIKENYRKKNFQYSYNTLSKGFIQASRFFFIFHLLIGIILNKPFYDKKMQYFRTQKNARIFLDFV